MRCCRIPIKNRNTTDSAPKRRMAVPATETASTASAASASQERASISAIFSRVFSAEAEPAVTGIMDLPAETTFGCKKEIKYSRVEKCAGCGGTGCASGTSPKVCSKCGGTGQIKVQQRTPLGVFQTTKTCDACGGAGQTIANPCKTCRGTGITNVSKTLEVSIPAGIDNGQRITLRGMGNCGKNGGPSGDLYIAVQVRAHSVFTRDGFNIYCEIPITFPEAALGAEIRIPTLEGDTTYTIPEGTQTGTSFTIKGKGIPYINGKGRGDLIFKVTVEVPKGMNELQKDALRKFAEACGKSNYSKKEKFFSKIFGKDKG